MMQKADQSLNRLEDMAAAGMPLPTGMRQPLHMVESRTAVVFEPRKAKTVDQVVHHLHDLRDLLDNGGHLADSRVLWLEGLNLHHDPELLVAQNV
jgi:hypothetical protein